MSIDYDQWLLKDYNEPTDDKPCELCGKDLDICKSECHKQGEGYCHCQNSDCTYPEPKVGA